MYQEAPWLKPTRNVIGEYTLILLKSLFIQPEVYMSMMILELNYTTPFMHLIIYAYLFSLGRISGKRKAQ